MKKILFLTFLGGVIASPAVFAQATCATAVDLTAPSTVNGDTSTGTADIDEVAIPLNGAKSLKYKFVAGANVDATFAMGSPAPTWKWGIYAASNCAPSSNLLNAVAYNDADPVLRLSTQGDTYTAGSTYYIIVSTSGDGSATDQGPFVMNVTPNLPVTVQSFSID